MTCARVSPPGAAPSESRTLSSRRLTTTPEVPHVRSHIPRDPRPTPHAAGEDRRATTGERGGLVMTATQALATLRLDPARPRPARRGPACATTGERGGP